MPLVNYDKCQCFKKYYKYNLRKHHFILLSCKLGNRDIVSYTYKLQILTYLRFVNNIILFQSMSTGEVEVMANDFSVINAVQKKLPFSIRNYNKVTISLLLLMSVCVDIYIIFRKDV